MYTLTVYQGCDRSKPIRFSGKSKDSAVKELSEWMTTNNGMYHGQPRKIGGLALFGKDRQRRYMVVLNWNYEKESWEIITRYDGGPFYYNEWDNVLYDFLIFIEDYGEWKKEK